MHFSFSIDCICSRFRSRDLHHVLILVPMWVSFSASVDFHSLNPSLRLLYWGVPHWQLLSFPLSAIIFMFQLQL